VRACVCVCACLRVFERVCVRFCFVCGDAMLLCDFIPWQVLVCVCMCVCESVCV